MKIASYYHASLKPIARSAGRSAVACAAYRTGARLEDVRYGIVRDFERKGDVVTSFTLAPDGAPDWATDTAQLWNAVEAKENRKNSQLAFEWEVALPNELDPDQREAIARDFSQWLVGEYGVAVTTGIHEGGGRGNGKNDHMHVMMTTRAVTEEGWAKHKLRQFSTQPGKPNAEVDRVREQIAQFINDALEDAGSDERVDHRSYADRGIDLEPTTHLGPAASAMERRGSGDTDRGDLNRSILEDRLAWQMEQAQPEIDAAIAHDLAARFGDPVTELFEGAQAEARRVDRLIEEARTGAAIPEDVVAHATAGKEAVDEDTAASGRSPPPAPRGWIARLRRLGADLMQLLRDEGGDPDASEPAQDGPERGFTHRLVDAGRKLWSGWSHRDSATFVRGEAEAVDLAAEGFAAYAADRSGAGAAPQDGQESWTWRNRVDATRAADDRAAGEGPEPPDPFELMRAALHDGAREDDVVPHEAGGFIDQLGAGGQDSIDQDAPDLD